MFRIIWITIRVENAIRNWIGRGRFEGICGSTDFQRAETAAKCSSLCEGTAATQAWRVPPVIAVSLERSNITNVGN
jgi:hypothetical protein